MHLTIEFSSDKDIILPIHYNHLVQGFIYDTIDEKLAEFLHSKGYGEGRNFKLFCFSNIFGKADNHSIPEHLVFKNKITLEVCSPMTDFCDSFANGIFKKTIRLGSNILNVESIKVDNQYVVSENTVLAPLSPIVAYSTLLKPEGKKYTCYFQPGEEDFQRIVAENLRKKYKAYMGAEPPEDDIIIRPISTPKLHLVIYKGFVIKGYTCKLKIKGPKELIQIAVDAGLGSKNSQGFGCVRLANVS